MGLFQSAIETFDAQSKLIGVERVGHQTLAPISHVRKKAEIQITLDSKGAFAAAEKSSFYICIPATEDSISRTSKRACSYPLCENLEYLIPQNEEKYKFYVNQLETWETSSFSHPMLSPILAYVKKGTILYDLEKEGIIELDEDGDLKENDRKKLVCWCVHGFGTPKEGCWQQPSLVKSFQKWYMSTRTEKDFCMITGKTAIMEKLQPKILENAKLISSNDTEGFTFRGRFIDAAQALTIGYEASQKAHNALQWLMAEESCSVGEGKRIFLCWNPEGIPICHAIGPFGNPEYTSNNPSAYRRKLQETLQGMRSRLPEKDCKVIIASFDRATSGRLSITYYNELMGSDFLQRLHDWDKYCCWWSPAQEISSPELKQIVQCALGRLKKTKDSVEWVVDDKLMAQQLQTLIHCRVDKSYMPKYIMDALFYKASNLQIYNTECRKELLFVACAVIQKYRYDVFKEESDMELHLEKDDRSYQFGRLLAVLEKVERDTYEKDEKRESNAIRYQPMFCHRPLRTFEQIHTQLNQAYFPRLDVSKRNYYRRIIGDIINQIKDSPENTWNSPLKETYLIGYYLQRKELYAKKESDKEEL